MKNKAFYDKIIKRWNMNIVFKASENIQKKMIKYYYKPSTKQTFAVLRGCQLDAVNKISKMTGNIREVCLTTDYLMKDTYRVSVKCSDSDEFDVEKGKEVARNRVLMSYYKDMEFCMAKVADLFYALHEIAADKAEECYLYEERLAVRQENF